MAQLLTAIRALQHPNKLLSKLKVNIMAMPGSQNKRGEKNTDWACSVSSRYARICRKNMKGRDYTAQNNLKLPERSREQVVLSLGEKKKKRGGGRENKRNE